MVLVLVFAFGAIFGSFLGAWTYRLPRKIKINEGRSFCPKCRSEIAWYDNIPLFSYILLAGRCCNCKKKISVREPLVEIFTAVLFGFIYLAFTSCGSSSLLAGSLICEYKGAINAAALPYFLLMAFFLIGIFITDLEHKIIPDEFSYLLYLVAFAVVVAANPDNLFTRLFLSTLPALFLFSLNLLTRGRGMGLGDVKLVLFGPLVLVSWQLVVSWMMLSFITGAVIGVVFILIGYAKLGNQIPFGPFIIFSFFVTLLFSDIIYKLFWLNLGL